MGTLDDLVSLEEGFWRATRDPDYYRRHMREDGLAVFSIGVLDKEAARRSTMADVTTDWSDVRIEEPRLIDVDQGVAALVYVGRATRDGTPYAATCASVYTRTGGEWQMVLHQQSHREDG